MIVDYQFINNKIKKKINNKYKINFKNTEKYQNRIFLNFLYLKLQYERYVYYSKNV